MNAQELIASGLLEAYVLGEGSSEERALVERMASEFPDVKAELNAIELSLEDHAVVNAVEPPARVRASIMNAIGVEDARVLPLTPLKSAGRPRNWLAAAAIVALICSGAVNFLLFNKLDQVNDRLADLENERTVLAERMEVQQVSMRKAQDQLAVVFDPNKHIVPLAGQALHPKAAARVFMDPATHDIYIDVLSLPTPPAGKQYQLWAQVDGQLVDAGMLDVADNGEHLQQMKTVAHATAFGVTLEPTGGSATPTLTELYLFGQAG